MEPDDARSPRRHPSFAEKFGREGLTFDDVLLVPAASEILPSRPPPRAG